MLPAGPEKGVTMLAGKGDRGRASSGPAVKRPKLEINCVNREQTADRRNAPEGWKYSDKFAQVALTKRSVNILVTEQAVGDTCLTRDVLRYLGRGGDEVE